MSQRPTVLTGRPSQRVSERWMVRVPARLVWKDARGTPRIASVVTRNVSEQGMLVECLQGTPIPLYRLVSLHLDPVTRERCDLPDALRRPHVSAAVFRVGPYSPVTGAPEHYALRVLVKPERRARTFIESTVHQPGTALGAAREWVTA